MEETTGLSKQQKKSMETKAKIFKAAKRILQRSGYETLSIKNICEEAGVSNGSFYHHFKTKDDLLSYYIEDQGLEICASDQPEELIIVSKQQPFEIREAGLSRDQGISTKKAVIKQDVTYYIILESKHEISIKATKRC